MPEPAWLRPSGFDKVRVGGSDTVKIVRGRAKLLDSLEIQTKGRRLLVGRTSSMGMDWAAREDVVVTVMHPAIHAAELAGSDDVTIDGAEFGASLSGSGTISARRKTGAPRADLVGSGDLKAEDLRPDTAAIAFKRVGSAWAFTRKSASLTLTGSGVATVKGTRECALTSRDSGNVRCTG